MTLLSRSVIGLLLLLFAATANAQWDPANDIVCPSELTYQDCVDEGYFNHTGNGRGGGGGGGGYCQDMTTSSAALTPVCNGVSRPCAFNFCQNFPGSHQYCEQYPITCCDGTSGSTAVLFSCY